MLLNKKLLTVDIVHFYIYSLVGHI